MAVPLLERQLAPIPNPPPIIEERLQGKSMVVCVYKPDSYNLVYLQLRNGSSYKPVARNFYWGFLLDLFGKIVDLLFREGGSSAPREPPWLWA